jgi:alpha-beta hydrolase superfamily lysophospholipase
MGKGALSLEKMYRKLGVSKVRSKIYPNMRHEILNEDKKDEVIQDIADFLLG